MLFNSKQIHITYFGRGKSLYWRKAACIKSYKIHRAERFTHFQRFPNTAKLKSDRNGTIHAKTNEIVIVIQIYAYLNE